MKNIVDSCGWLEYFADGVNANYFTSPIEDTKNLIVPSICVFEVFKRVYQQRGENDALQAIALMHQGKIVTLDDIYALSAAKCSLDYNLPMADSVIMATAQLQKAIIWTQDIDFKNISGVKYIEAKKIKRK
ncbi:MAG: type II toxin-antitoxin system VapC family toxin [Candidatus Omnitrophota bacterium]|nr:type II toxin-antitoxin system VapC family toxin [Candidatus Omnitrophota bacterium]